jgi:hypothetical protein
MKIEAHRKILLLAILLVLLSPLPVNAACGNGSFSDFKLTSPTPVPTASVHAQFGHSVAVSGNNMVVGVTAEQAVYVFSYDEDEDSWIPKQKLTVEKDPDDPEPVVFGWSVAIDGETVVVGDYFAHSAYVFIYDKDEGSWIEQERLSVTGLDMLGFSVAVSGDTVVVGTPFAGLAYVFKRQTGPEWSQEELPIIASLGKGWAVAISGDTLVVGDPIKEAAHVFTRTLSDSFSEPTWTWKEDKKLTTDEEAVGEFFGASVAIDGDTVVVGAPPYLNGFIAPVELPGSAHVFSRRELADGTWQWDEDENLPLSQAVNGFGLSVAISRDRLVVGAPNDADDAGVITGAAYLFKYDGSNWVEDPVQRKLIPTTEPGLEEGDQFGWAVTIDDGTIAVGSPSNYYVDTEVLKAGAAYVFMPNEAPVSEVYSTLGRSRHRFFPAWEIFEFTGARGDKATLTFEADPNGENNNGKGVSVFVKDKIRGVRFFSKNRWALGAPMEMDLPADGEYRIVVFGHPWFFRSKGFRGDYTLKLEGICAELSKVSRRKKCK